jgi:hypothetical protein
MSRKCMSHSGVRSAYRGGMASCVWSPSFRKILDVARNRVQVAVWAVAQGLRGMLDSGA